MSSPHILRITREILDLQKGPDLSLAVAFRENDVRNVRALIIGPPDTPYEFGFFELNVTFGITYPTKSPQVRALTTNRGHTRFNPNIYAEGKVCLSILGTWRGESREQWSTAQGLESILISIQSLLSSNPYENEPGHETCKLESKEATKYAAKVSFGFKLPTEGSNTAQIRHETLRITVAIRLEALLGINRPEEPSAEETEHKAKKPKVSKATAGGELTLAAAVDDGNIYEYNADQEIYDSSEDAIFDPFADLFKRRFLWYYDAYMRTIDEAIPNTKEGQAFEIADFEYPSNTMSGKYEYKKLHKRFLRIREALMAETDSWAIKGMQAVADEKGIASNLQRQFEQLSGHFKHNITTNVDLSLVNKNPFVWEILMFGRPMTNLDGGIFNIRIYFSTRFPDEQPRVVVLTPIFHHRVSTTGGVLCYFPSKPEEVRNHIEAIISAIEEESPAYDPRTLVNPEAAGMLWGGEAKRKMYTRKLRRSVQDSSEE